MVLDSYSFSDKGGREDNQDSVALREAEQSGIYVVADGLGGHRGGRAAADCVTSTIIQAWEEGKPEGADDGRDWIYKQLEKANADIIKMQQEENGNMKSTAVVLSIVGDSAIWANTGDSRLYHIRRGKLESITEDHSVAFRKYKAGEISRAQLCTDEDQSRLMKALGKEAKWEPDIYACPIEAGDAFLLCTDGLWEYVSDTEILVDSLKSVKAQDWARFILLRAIARIKPGTDNISLISVMVG